MAHEEQEWIRWAREIQAISQSGLVFTKNPFDIERYEKLARLSHEMFAKIGDIPVAKVSNLFVADEGYCTPKVDLRAGLFDENRVLMVKEKSDHRWTLPGGWADVNESPTEGVIREVEEEAGYRVDTAELVAIMDRGKHPYTPSYPHHVYKLFFYCTYSGNEQFNENLETEDVGFFDVDSLPELSVARVLPQDITRLFEYHQHKGPVYVD